MGALWTTNFQWTFIFFYLLLLYATQFSMIAYLNFIYLRRSLKHRILLIIFLSNFQVPKTFHSTSKLNFSIFNPRTSRKKQQDTSTIHEWMGIKHKKKILHRSCLSLTHKLVNGIVVNAGEIKAIKLVFYIQIIARLYWDM